jgi:ankyrin repeat protein
MVRLRRYKVNKRRVIVAVLAVLIAASAYAQATDFFELVKTGTPQSIQATIDKGADLKAQDKDGCTLLMLAAANNPNPEVIATLLKAGANLKDRDPKYGEIVLMFAAAHNPKPEIITTLLKAGADLKAVDNDGTTLLYAAEQNSNPEIITPLLKAGANMNAQDKDGLTALMAATGNNGNPEVITPLLKAGANAKVKNSDGKTALDYAKGNLKLSGTDALKQLEKVSK